MGEVFGVVGVSLMFNELFVYLYDLVVYVQVVVKCVVMLVVNGVLLMFGLNVIKFFSSVLLNMLMVFNMLVFSGGGGVYENWQLYLVVNFCIVFEGQFFYFE